jgi:hypothetical protein
MACKSVKPHLSGDAHMRVKDGAIGLGARMWASGGRFHGLLISKEHVSQPWAASGAGQGRLSLHGHRACGRVAADGGDFAPTVQMLVGLVRRAMQPWHCPVGRQTENDGSELVAATMVFVSSPSPTDDS